MQYGTTPLLEFKYIGKQYSSVSTIDSVAIDTNIPLSKKIYWTVVYDENSAAEPWADSVSYAQDFKYFRFRIADNKKFEPRTARFRLRFQDDWGEDHTTYFTAYQGIPGGTAETREMTFEELRGLIAEAEGEITLDQDIAVSGTVISDWASPNMAGSPMPKAAEKPDLGINDCTAYMQNADASLGLALVTTDAQQNNLQRYDKLKLWCKGLTLTKRSNPERYTLSGVTQDHIVTKEAGTAEELPAKRRFIDQLTDADIYTQVTLKRCQMAVRTGRFIPVHINYTNSFNNYYPAAVLDRHGDMIYLMTNHGCDWRFKEMLDGEGTITGIIVHEPYTFFERGGDIGRYQIRHQTKGDIWDNMQNSVEDSFSALLTEYRYWNPDKENKVQKPTYGTNGYLTHTYQEKYTGSASKEYLQATFQQHMWGGGTYEYLGPVGNNASYIFGANFGNKNGIGIVIDPSKESWNPLMDNLVSHNPDGTLEWCGPYAADTKYVGCGTGGWTSNEAISTTSGQINYNGSTGMRGKGNVYGSCYTAFANHFWWDDDTDRPYAWLINFSTEGITTSHISMKISVMNTQQSFFSPRFWCAEWSLTDSQAAKDDSQWNLIGEYTIPDVSVWANTLYSSCVAYKSINFELPQEILGQPNVYIRLRPTSDLCSDGSDYANARLNQSASGAALAAEHASSLEYFAIRYNK